MSGAIRRLLQDRLRSAVPARVLAGRRAADAGPLLDEAMLRQLMRLRIESGTSFTEWLTGEHEGRRKTHAIEFEDYRGYAEGDDFRLIDWNAYARLGELFVKTSVAEETMSIGLLIDCSRSMEWGRPTKLRYAKQLAAALGALALMHGDRVQAAGIGEGNALIGAPLYGPASVAALSAELEALPVMGSTDLAGSIASFQQQAQLPGLVVVLSDLLAPMTDIGALDFLALQERSIVVMHIIDPAEAAPDLAGTIELRDRESGATAIRAVTPDVRRHYIKRFQERAAAIESRLAQASIHYIAVSTALAPLDFIGSGLQGEGLVATV